MPQVKKVFAFFFFLLLHASLLVAILLAFWPIAKWYFDSNPAWGVDFFYTATLTNLIKNNLTFPPAGWNYAWFSGWPLLSNYPLLHYYLILPITYFFDLISSVKIYMLFAFAVFFIGLYASFFRLSKNFALSAVLSIAAVYSVGVYGPLMWGGSLPNHATQAFFPWAIFFVISYLQSKNKKYLFLGGLVAGLAILGHPQIVIVYIYPVVTLLFLFSFAQISFKERIKSLLIFLFISFLIGLPQLTTSGPALRYFLVKDTFQVATSTARLDPELAGDIAAFHRKQPERIYVDTNTTIFVFLAISFFVFLISFAWIRKRSTIAFIPATLIIALYFVIYIWLLAFGISIYHGGWYRLFWATPFWLGILISSFWGSLENALREKLPKYSFISQETNLFIFALLTNLFVASIGSILLLNFSKDLKERVIPRSNTSSAFPDILNMKTGNEFEALKGKMLPNWLDPERTDFRLYDGDQTVNIWWNSLYKMPLARGYLDPPYEKSKGYIFWLDASLSVDNQTGEDQLASAFDYPPEAAFNNTLFLLDWNAIKFFEAGREGPTTFASLPRRLASPDYIEKEEILDFNKEKYNKGNQTLRYHELKDEMTSPILLATNSPTIGIFASLEGYETVIRGLADANLNSKKVIPIATGRLLDAVGNNDLESFDALILYDYKYKDDRVAFRRLLKYVEGGGKIFIDTGIEGPESQRASLPDIFPFEATKRLPLGSDWQIEGSGDPIFAAVDFSSFSPPLFDQYEWKFSFSESEDIRRGAEVLLRNHGKVVLTRMKIGEGEIIWSGLNFPYHVTRYHNQSEIRLLNNIVKNLLSEPIEVPSYTPEFVNSQKRVLTSTGAKGVIFKEQHYPGWNVRIKAAGKSKNLKIWSAGPSYPGFMYIRVPKEYSNSDFSTTFSYQGSFVSWMLFTISAMISLFIVEYCLTGGKVLIRLTRTSANLILAKVRSWWVNEEE